MASNTTETVFMYAASGIFGLICLSAVGASILEIAYGPKGESILGGTILSALLAAVASAACLERAQAKA